MIFIKILRFILKTFLKLVNLFLLALCLVFGFLAGIGALTEVLGKILLVIFAFVMIINTIPYMLLLPEITFIDVWQNVLIWLVIPLPFLFFTNIFLFSAKGVSKLRDKISAAITCLSEPIKGSKEYYEANMAAYRQHMKEIESQKNPAAR